MKKSFRRNFYLTFLANKIHPIFLLCWNFRTIYGARNRVVMGLSYPPARLDTLDRLAESIPGLLKSSEIPSVIKLFLPF